MRRKVDFLVIGSGIAGLSYALKVAEYGKVLIVTKSKADESSTKYAQGGIAGVMYSPDSYEKHISDTMIAGAGLCNEDIVRMTISESTERIQELIQWGTSFDKKSDGSFRLGKEGGHSEKRILHHKDKTGAEIERALLKSIRKHTNIELLEKKFSLDLITQHHMGDVIRRGQGGVECYGAYVLDPSTKKVETILAKCTLIATGGAGNVYRNTTNPAVSTGDGIAMVYRAKGLVENMEFIQFHPTALFNPGVKPSFLISEALRGFGAILKNHKGQSFMEKYDKRGSLAPRDIVARSIDKQMKKSGKNFVYLDATFLNHDDLIQSFPGIFAKCLSLGIDIRKEMIPVVPAAHYTCGGIKVDEMARTTIKNLYASGESSSSGLHGANRLASNSLLEAVVFSHRAAIDSKEKISHISYNDQIPDWNDEGTKLNEEMLLITQTQRELQSIMSSYVSIVRSNLRLQRALDRLGLIYRETEELYIKSVLDEQLCELRNSINVSYLIVKMAMGRKQSIGLHYSMDFKPRKKK